MTTPPPSIKPLRLWQAPQLERLFAAALESDFAYFDSHHRAAILRQNSAAHLAATVVRPTRLIFLAWHEGKLVGYVIGGLAPKGSSAIDWLYVKPETRGHNLGLKLLSTMLRHLERRGATKATLVTHNYASYYARQGFRYVDKVVSDGIKQDFMTYEFFPR